MNAARQEAAFENFGNSTALIAESEGKTNETPQDIWKSVCDTLLNGTAFSPSAETTPKGTYALYELGDVQNPAENLANLDGISPKCEDAVTKWQEGFSSFEANPPVDKPLAYADATRAQVSFVTLYNPSDKPNGQCALAACQGTPKTSEGSQKAGEKKTVAGLVCFTEPTAFGVTPLFTQDQWNNIKKVLSSSASTAVPSLMAMAALMFAAFLS
ncbi:hypothetical protein Emed_002177 [Eimeria media]